MIHIRATRDRLLAALRILRVACHIGYGLLLATFYPLLSQQGQRRILKHWSRALLDILHVGLDTYGCQLPASTHGVLLVANHVSWLDVIAMTAAVPSYFVAKSELGDWPLLGWMTGRVNALFLQRDMRRDTARINSQLAALLKHGENVGIFPEGTTSDGKSIRHFHSSLLQGAIDIAAPVCPLVIRYHDGTGGANDDAAFVGEMNFIQSLWNILRSPSLHVTIAYLPMLPSAGQNRRVLAAQAQADIQTALAQLTRGEFSLPRDGSPKRAWRDALLPLTPAYSLLLSPLPGRGEKPPR